jgi:hypothetical protein
VKTILILTAILPLIGGCASLGGANKEKFELAKAKVDAAKEMYLARQNTLRMNSISKASIAKASLGALQVQSPKEYQEQPVKKEVDCSAVEKDFLEKCDRTFGSGDRDVDLDDVCTAWRTQVDKEIERCQGQTTEQSESGNDEVAFEQENEISQDGGFLSEAVEQVESASSGPVVINQFIGDNNVGQRNNTSSGVGSQTIYSGGTKQVSGIDPETAAILSLANVDPDSDLKDGGKILGRTVDSAVKAIPYVAGAAVAGFVVDGYKEGMREAGPRLENSMNPDQSDRSIKNFAPAEGESVEE